jgi:4'-phosphopantetheinyl transferase
MDSPVGDLAKLGSSWNWLLAYTRLREATEQIPLNLLSADERDRVGRMRQSKDRERHAWGRILVRRLLSGLGAAPAGEIQIEVDSHGKPFVREGFPFSISHSGDCVLVAIDRTGAVGADVEYIARKAKTLELARHFFHTEEVAYIESGGEDQTTRFFRVWTAKEAYIKAVGLGLGISLSSFQVVDGDGDQGNILPCSGPEQLRWIRPLPGYISAVCSAQVHKMGCVVEFGTASGEDLFTVLSSRSVPAVAHSIAD